MSTSSSSTAEPQRRLTREDIVEAGVSLTRELGLQGVTIRAVAARLGVRGPSLYHHLPGGIEQLQSLVVTRVRELLESMLPPPAPAPATIWDVLEETLRVVQHAARDYRGVLEHLLTSGKDGPTTLAGAERTVLRLLDSELAAVAPEAFMVIHAYVTGWIFAQRPSSAAAREHGLSTLADVLATGEKLDQEEVMFDGLRALLSGMAQTALPAPSHPPGP